MADDPEQCRALTEGGKRCSRPARENGFCHQHDESDPTVDDESAEDESAEDESTEDESMDEASASDESAEGDADAESEPTDGAEDSGGERDDAETDNSTDEENEDGDDMSDDTDDGGGESGTGSESDGEVGLIDIRDTVRANATALIGHPLDAVVAIAPDDDDGWRAVVEVVERSSVPDTEDILGRYEVFLSESGDFQSYGRLSRYRRADTDVEAV